MDDASDQVSRAGPTAQGEGDGLAAETTTAAGTAAVELDARGTPGFAADEWVRVTDLPASGSQGGFTDPTALFDALEDLGGTVEQLGDDTVVGADVTRYRAELGAEELAEEVESQIAQLGVQPGSAEADALRDATIEAVTEVAVDAEGLIRQLRSTMTMTFGGELAEAGMDQLVTDQTFTLTEFGVPLDLTLPADVTEVTFLELQQRQAEAAGAQAPRD